MTASQYIKSQGLPSLEYVASKVNKPRSTVQRWFTDNNALFIYVVAGVKMAYNDE